MEHRQSHTVQDLIRVENWPLQAERREVGMAVEFVVESFRSESNWNCCLGIKQYSNSIPIPSQRSRQYIQSPHNLDIASYSIYNSQANPLPSLLIGSWATSKMRNATRTTHPNSTTRPLSMYLLKVQAQSIPAGSNLLTVLYVNMQPHDTITGCGPEGSGIRLGFHR